MTSARLTKTALLVAGCFFMENLDGTIVTTAAPRIGHALHVPSTSVGLVIAAYMVTLAVLIPLSGWMAARWGARTVFLSAITIFTLSSLACAVSTAFAELVIFRVLQGVGGAMMVPVGRLVVLSRYVPNSCVNAVLRFLPGDTNLLTAFTIPGARQLGAAVPDPGGARMALTLSPCTTRNGTTGVFIRNLSSGRTRPVFTTRNTCDQFLQPTWDASGRRIAFVFDRSRGLPRPSIGPNCTSASIQRLAIVRSDGGSQRRGPLLLSPDQGCVFGAVAFDRLGVVAMEGCQQGHPGWQPPDGYVYLKQFSSAAAFIRRVRIGIGLDDAEMARIPHTGSILATLNQGANEPWPERDWVSEFNGTQLRSIAHYKAWDANQIDAVPW